MVPYFAYGSNLNVKDMKFRAPDAVFAGAARLPGWRLTFRGVADIVEDERSTCPGGLWWLSASDVQAIDMYEGVPFLYEQVIVDVETADGPRRVLTYQMAEPLGRPGIPSGGYYSTVKRGYEDFSLDVAELNAAVVRVRDERESLEAGAHLLTSGMSPATRKHLALPG